VTTHAVQYALASGSISGLETAWLTAPMLQPIRLSRYAYANTISRTIYAAGN